MLAYGADLGSVRANDDVPAVATFPYLNLALLEDLLHFDVSEQCAVALLVHSFDRRNASELCRQIQKKTKESKN